MIRYGIRETLQSARLWTNLVEISQFTILTDLVEASFLGYSGFLNPMWAAPFLNGLNKGQSLAASIQWQSSGPFIVPNTVYGVYYENQDLELVALEPFPTPILVNAAGINIFFQPSVTCVSEPPASP